MERKLLENGPMILAAHLENPQSPARACDDDIEREEDSQSAAVLAQFIATADGFEKKEHSWFAMSQVPTDLCIQVQDVTFHVHKFPLVSKCGYFNRTELNNLSSNSELKFDNFPGGPETFETILKFCYSLPISLNIENIAALRCGAELLEMSEAIEEDNLITKSEAFFTFLVLSSWKDSVAVLKSCEILSPWAENLQIVRRCCDSIAWKIARGSSTLGGILNGENWWFNDTTTLRIDHFTRIVSALRAKGMSPEIIGSCIVRYADKWLPSIELDATGSSITCNKNELQWSITSGKRQETDTEITTDQRMIVESLVSILPPQREAVSCKFLLKMLKLAIFYSITPALVSELEKRAALVLESADVSDLLIPSYANEGKLLANSVGEDTMHNVDVVQRMLEYFLLYEQKHQQQLQQPTSSAISKLLDSYLAEIARDPKLPVAKFLFLAQFLPENARTCDDGLYRAIDTYLKTHPSLSDHERRRLCKIMNCNKLSQDACAHAAQNDRLPLRTIIQVLFSEQTKMRDAIKGNNQSRTPGNSDDQESNQSTMNNEVKGLKIELERVKTLLAELQKGHYEVQQDYRNRKNKNNNNNKERHSSGWSIGWRKIRRSALFQAKTDLEETEEIQSRGGQSQKGSFRRRRSIS